MINSDYIEPKILCKGILDRILGEEVDCIKKSFASHILRTIFNNNSHTALQENNIIKQNFIEKYLVYEEEFNTIAYNLLERKRIILNYLNLSILLNLLSIRKII